jgi:hypothetical protein
MEITSAEQHALLEQFVVENDDLLELESEIGRFNIFDALGIARKEISHSNFLAFILDPAESHGVGQLFLKALLTDMLKRAPTHMRPLSPIELDGIDLRGAEVRREWKNIDLLILSREPSLAILIENKVDSSEHSQQLERYGATAQREFASVPRLQVYLTPDGSDASGDDWISYSYRDIYRVFTRVRETYHNAIGDDVLVFLDHYLGLIRNQLMTNPDIDALCQRIYKNHRQALDLIFARAGPPASRALADAEAAVRADDRFHVFYRTKAYVDFVPRDWLSWLPEIGMDWREDRRSWFVFRFELGDHSLNFFIEVRRTDNVANRRHIAQALIDNSSTLGFKRARGELTDNYTRVSGRERLLDWADEEGPETERVAEAVARRLELIMSRADAIAAVIRQVV